MRNEESGSGVLNKKSDYAVGYGKPPKHSQWKKGQSGNYAGRKKGSKNKPKGALAALNALVLKEGRSKIRLNIDGQVKSLSVQEGIIKQNNLKALKGNGPAIRLATDLMRIASKEQVAAEDAAERERQALAKKASRIKSFWTRELKQRRRLGEQFEMPVPHPDHILIDEETGEVTVKWETAEKQNECIELIDRLASMEADSYVRGFGLYGLFSEPSVRQIICNHIDQGDIDFSTPEPPKGSTPEEASAFRMKALSTIELPSCACSGCGVKNQLAQNRLHDWAVYEFARTIIPVTDPLWREYGPKLFENHVDYRLYYGPRPSPERFMHEEASLPDRREENLIMSLVEPCEEELEFKDMMREVIREQMGDCWSERFTLKNIRESQVDVDYRVYKMLIDGRDPGSFSRDFFDGLVYPSYLDRFRIEPFEFASYRREPAQAAHG